MDASVDGDEGRYYFVKEQCVDAGQLDEHRALPPDTRTKIVGHLHWEDSRRLRSTCRTLHSQISEGGELPAYYVGSKRNAWRRLDVLVEQEATGRLEEVFKNCFIKESSWLAHLDGGDGGLGSERRVCNVAVALSLSKTKDGAVSKVVLLRPGPDRVGGSDFAVLMQSLKGFDCSDFLNLTKVADAQLVEVLVVPREKQVNQRALRRKVLNITYETSGDESAAFVQRMAFSRQSGELCDMQYRVIDGAKGRNCTKATYLQTLASWSKSHDWVEVDDARRLLHLASTLNRNPRPAPGGVNHSARRLPPTPGLGFRLFGQARQLTDNVYDRRRDGQDVLLNIPFWLVECGKSQRIQNRLKQREARLAAMKERAARKREAHILAGHAVRDEPERKHLAIERLGRLVDKTFNVRGTTLLVDFGHNDGDGKAKAPRGTLLPCELKGDLSTLSYPRLLRTIGGGWHCWPEAWWRRVEKFVSSKHFSSSHMATPRVDGVLVFGVPVHATAHCKLLHKARRLLAQNNSKAMVTVPRGETVGFHLNQPNNQLALVVHEGDSAEPVAQLIADMSAILDAFPKWAVQHGLHRRTNSQGFKCGALRLTVQSTAAFGKDRQLAAMLHAAGCDPTIDLVADAEKARPLSAEKRAARRLSKSTSGGEHSTEQSAMDESWSDCQEVEAMDADCGDVSNRARASSQSTDQGSEGAETEVAKHPEKVVVALRFNLRAKNGATQMRQLMEFVKQFYE